MGRPEKGAAEAGPAAAPARWAALAGQAFTKMSGGGNDFLVFDDRDRSFPRADAGLVAALCARGTGVGADAVLLLDHAGADGAEFRMVYYNADGSEAPMCGNGALCIARFGRGLGYGRDGAVTFDTGAGRYRAELSDAAPTRVRLFMRDPGRIETSLPEIEHLGHERAGFADTGTPHLIALVEDVGVTDVGRLGPVLAHHPRFAPDGLNVDFVQVLGAGELAIRTYERGVEAETLSCGTGAAAAALLTHLWDLTGPPVVVRPPGGLQLRVDFRRDGDTFRDLTLEGDARVVYEGRLSAC